MPDQDPKPAEKTGLQKLLDSAAGTEEKSSLPVAAFFIGIFVLILAILGIKMVLTKRAAAETARKLREQLEAERQAHENAKLADNDAQRKDAEEVIRDAMARVTELQNEMDARRVAHEEHVKELSSITSWDQIVVDARK
jgi:hypothetical protein